MRIGSSSPSSERRCAFTAIRRKLATVTPGIADGYWNARNMPSRERSSGSSSSTSVPLNVTSPAVTSYAGWPMSTWASVDFPEPLGPMMA